MKDLLVPEGPRRGTSARGWPALAAAAAPVHDLLTPVNVLVGLTLAAAAGGLAGWMLHRLRVRSQIQAQEAWESEMARAAGRARDRAFEEREQAEDRLVRLQDEHAQCETKIEALARRLSERDATIDTLKVDLTGAMEASEENKQRVCSLQARIDELEAALEERDERDGAPGWLLAEPDGARDDLTTIRGLGTVLEQRLNALGVYRYRQLAQMTPANARWIAMKLQIVPGRILSDRWAEQAREMQRRKYDQPA